MGIERLLDFLEAFHPYLLVGMEVFQHFPRKEVFLKCHHIRIRLVVQYGIHKRAHPGRRLQYPVGAYPAIV